MGKLSHRCQREAVATASHPSPRASARMVAANGATIACAVVAAISCLAALPMLMGNADVIPATLKQGTSMDKKGNLKAIDPDLLVHLARTLGHEILAFVIVIAASVANNRCALLAKFLACGMLLSAGWHHAWGNQNEVIGQVVFAAVFGYFGLISSGATLPATKWGKHAITCTLQACIMGAVALSLLSGSADALPTALKSLHLGSVQAIGKDLGLSALCMLAGALDNNAPTLCKFWPVGIMVTVWSHAMMDDMQGAVLNSCFALGFAILGFGFAAPETGGKKAQ